MLQQQFHCFLPFQGNLLADGGKSRRQILGDFHIIKSNNRIIIRHSFACFIEALHSADGQNIRRCHNPCRR